MAAIGEACALHADASTSRRTRCAAETKLPNGLEIFQYATLETSFLYKEIFEDDTYTRNGIRVEPGSTVFGALRCRAQLSAMPLTQV